jgi:hypothetical protein
MRASFLLLSYTLIVILVGPVLLVCWVFGRMRPIPDGRSPLLTFSLARAEDYVLLFSRV